MRKISAALVSVCLVACGPTVRRDMPEAEARSAIIGFISNRGHGCTDATILDLRAALASYSVHMDQAGRTWPHPVDYRLAPNVAGKKIKLRTLDDTDFLALLAVRDGLAPVSDFAPLAREMIETTWSYHTPKIHRKRFGDYGERIRTASCDAFLTMARSRFESDRVRMQIRLTRSGSISSRDAKARNQRASECALNRAITAAGGAAEPCED